MPTPSMLETIWQIQAGDLAPEAALAAAITRARAAEPQLHAFFYLDPTPRVGDGPLAGIAIGVKDVIDTAGIPTTIGSPIYKNRIPASDAWIVSRLKALGGTMFGKTANTEFAWRQPGPTVNPHNPAHTPGGSSSGSAAAVAAGILPLAIGSQTIGSIVRPAAFCGAVGYKPSHGAISVAGVHPLAPALDHLGFFTMSVADAAAADALFIANLPEVVVSQAAWAEYFPAISAPSFAVLRDPAYDHADADARAHFDDTLARLAACGATLTDWQLPMTLDEFDRHARIILAFEASIIFEELMDTDEARISAPIRELVAAGNAMSEAVYQESRDLQDNLRHELAGRLNGHDAVLSLSALGGAPAGLANTGDPLFCIPWSYLGAPAISIPSGRAANNLPLGLQLSAGFGQDETLLQAAAWAERALV